MPCGTVALSKSPSGGLVLGGNVGQAMQCGPCRGAGFYYTLDILTEVSMHQAIE